MYPPPSMGEGPPPQASSPELVTRCPPLPPPHSPSCAVTSRLEQWWQLRVCYQTPEGPNLSGSHDKIPHQDFTLCDLYICKLYTCLNSSIFLKKESLLILRSRHTLWLPVDRQRPWKEGPMARLASQLLTELLR